MFLKLLYKVAIFCSPDKSVVLPNESSRPWLQIAVLRELRRWIFQCSFYQTNLSNEFESTGAVFMVAKSKIHEA